MLFLGLLPGMRALRRCRGAELLRIPGGELGQSEGLFANTQKPDACVVPESRNSPLGSSAVRRCIATIVTLQATKANSFENRPSTKTQGSPKSLPFGIHMQFQPNTQNS